MRFSPNSAEGEVSRRWRPEHPCNEAEKIRSQGKQSMPKRLRGVGKHGCSEASSDFIPNGFWNHLNNREDLDPSLICWYFCGKEKSRKTRRFKSSQHRRASAASARVNAEAFLRYFYVKSFPLLSKKADRLGSDAADPQDC